MDGHERFIPRKIISGGQTGADRAALDVALELSIACGGWCPRGRLADDGEIPVRYPLLETKSADPLERTERNMREADAIVIFSLTPRLGQGTKQIWNRARALGKPLLRLRRNDANEPVQTLSEFLTAHRPAILNAAGSRESDEPGVGEWVQEILRAAFTKT